MSWRDLVPCQHMTSLLMKHFFPKWIQVWSSNFLSHFSFHLVATQPSLLCSSGSFPVLIQVLCQWLCNNPNYDEVSKWYMGWKSMFPYNLLSQPLIRGSFDPNTNLVLFVEHIRRVNVHLLFPSFQTNSIKLCPSWTEPLQATGSQKQPISWRHNNKRLRHQQRRQNHRSTLSSYQWWFIYYIFLNG